MADRPDSPTLSDAQIQRFRAAGEERDVAAGDVLFREGDPSYDFFVVLDGAVEVYADLACERAITPEPLRAGKMLGEMGLLLGESVYATARVEADGRVLRVPADAFRDLLARDTDLAETVLAAFAERRGLVSAGASGLTLVGAQTDPDAARLAEFARRNYLPVRWLTPDEPDARDALRRAGRDPAPEAPVVLWGTETVLDNPTALELADAVGILGEMPEDETADLVVVGAGPAGLAAAVYGASEGLKTVVVDEVGPGGQAGASSRIENYLGFPAGVSGTDLATRATVQARKFGACLATPRRAVALGRDGDAYTVALSGDDAPTLRGRAVVIATGATYNRLPLANLRRFEGAGVYYAATEMEARGCEGRTVVVVGGGNSAGQAAMFLSERADRVLLLLRGGDLRKSMSAYLAERVEATDGVDLRCHTEVRALWGDGAAHEALAAVTVEDTETGDEERVETPALFTFIGASPCTDWLKGDGSGRLGLALDGKGFVLAGADVPAECLPDDWGDERPTTFETSLRGVFAVGDVRSGSTKRVAGAVGEGSVAVKAVHARLAPPRPEP